MSKALPFFKFDPTEWLIGRISFQPVDIQGAFVQCCSMYWKLGGNMKDSDIDFRIGKEYLQKLKDLGFVKQKEEGLLSIVFLDNQLEECEKMREQMRSIGRNGGIKKAAKRMPTEDLPIASEPLADASLTLSEPLASKSKSKSKEIKEKKKVFVPPSLQEVKEYFREHGYKAFIAEKAYRGYSENNWRDTKDNKITNWKTKMNNVWFTEENRDLKVLPVERKLVEKPMTLEYRDSLFGER